MDKRVVDWSKDGAGLVGALFLLVGILAIIALFAWWAFSWSTHTLVWFIFIFGSILGSVKVRTN